MGDGATVLLFRPVTCFFTHNSWVHRCVYSSSIASQGSCAGVVSLEPCTTVHVYPQSRCTPNPKSSCSQRP